MSLSHIISSEGNIKLDSSKLINLTTLKSEKETTSVVLLPPEAEILKVRYPCNYSVYYFFSHTAECTSSYWNVFI